MSTGEFFIDVKHGGDLIRIYIKDGLARFQVTPIDNVEIVIEALNRAVAAGATRGMMLTGALIPEDTAAKSLIRDSKGVTWLGGKVTFLGMLPDGPEFRVDWDELPTITV
jgi:hypothetical protein